MENGHNAKKITEFTFDPNQTYKIMSVRSGKVIDVPGGSLHGI